MFVAVRCASAITEIIGLVPLAVGIPLASPMYTPGVSCNSPDGLATEVCGSLPSRQLLIWCAETSSRPPARSGVFCTALMNASRSSPRRQRHGTDPIGTICSAPAAWASRICFSMEVWATRMSISSVSA